MEIVDICTGRRWRLRLDAEGERALSWLQAFDPDGLPEPEAVAPDVWRFEAPRELATSEDPLLEIRVRLKQGAAHVRARVNGNEVAYRNPRADVADIATSGLMRPATPEETLETGLRALMLYDHAGCADPEQVAFHGRKVDMLTYVVTDARAWLEGGAPFPSFTADGRCVGVFAAPLCGQLIKLKTVREIADAIESRTPSAYVGVYMPAAGTDRLLLAFGVEAFGGRSSVSRSSWPETLESGGG